MTMTTGGDAPNTVEQEPLANLRAAMLAAEPEWPILAGELARQLQVLGPLVAGTVQGVAAEHALYEYRRELEVWHTLADRYYAAFDKTISGRDARMPQEGLEARTDCETSSTTESST